MFNINYNKYIDEFIKNNNIKNSIIYFADKLSCENNINDLISSIFKEALSSDLVIIADAVVFNDDAYTNTIYSYINGDFKRIYQVNEILNITSKYASLEYFIKFKEYVNVSNIPNNLIDDIPENIKKDMLIIENNNLKALNQNFAVYVFKKY